MKESIQYFVIDFFKYLKCPDCKKVELYCEKHRNEVESILETKI